jgi:hypothetical protein
MGEVHEGLCGRLQLTPKMRWMLWRAGLYWTTMMDDCIRYRKGCEACQRFGDVQLVPASVLNPIVKPWPFRGWGLNFVGEIHPSSSRGHQFVLVATDYFAKGMEVMPLKNMTHKEVIILCKNTSCTSLAYPKCRRWIKEPLSCHASSGSSQSLYKSSC